MNTVDSIINLIRRYGMACYNQASPEHFDAEVKDALLLQIHTALQEFAAEQAGGPVAYIAWKDGKPCYEGDDAICEDAVWPVDSDDDRTSMPVFTAPQPAAQEPTSAVPVVEMMVEALEGVVVGADESWALTCKEMNSAGITSMEISNDMAAALNQQVDAIKLSRAALEAGQKYLKENGK